MDLALLQQTWNELARRDPMWAVLTGPPGSEQSWNADAFLLSGRQEVDALLARVGATGTPLPRGRALDFGCGIGRLTQALAAHFAQVDAVDIAPAMIEAARRLNRAGDHYTFHVNSAPDLAVFEDGAFDFVYSNITLQHMEPRFSRGYIAEFFRVTRPGGVVVFQVPSHSLTVERPRTRQPDRLPREACRATIQAPHELRCGPGATLPLRVMVRNDGESVWAASDRHEDDVFAIRLGNHWRSRFGFVKIFDDLRTGLPFDLPPGEWVEMGINPVAPAKRGVYILELDLVQEYVRWFAEAGSKTLRIRVTVDPSLSGATVLGLPPRMEMYGIPRQEIEALIARSAGVVLAIDEDDAPGPDWQSFRYIARRAG